MQHIIFEYEVSESKNDDSKDEQNYVDLFVLAKKIEDCSEKSLKYYGATINAMINDINKKIKNIKTDDIRTYLTEDQSNKNSNRVKIDNISRILFSFILRLEDDC